MARGLIIRSRPQACEVIKEMGLSVEKEADYRQAGRRAVVEMRVAKSLNQAVAAFHSRPLKKGCVSRWRGGVPQ